jgi:hypothetical protein
MDLAKLVIDGFETDAIRAQLDTAPIPFAKEERSIVLLEKLLRSNQSSAGDERLIGLRTVQTLKGHVGGIEADQLAHEALMEHETFNNHFKHVSRLRAAELRTIERTIS